MIKKSFIKYLIAGLIAIIAFNLALSPFKKQSEIPTVRYEHQITDEKKYILTEEAVLSNLKMKSQIVSLEQELHKKQTMVDKKLFGERQTEIRVDGKFKMGLETKDIKVVSIDSSNNSVVLDLPKPTLISLDLPFDKIEFDKTQGFFRLAINEEEEKNFYKATRKTIHNELSKNKELLKQADLYNQEVVRELLENMGIKYIKFE